MLFFYLATPQLLRMWQVLKENKGPKQTGKEQCRNQRNRQQKYNNKISGKPPQSFHIEIWFYTNRHLAIIHQLNQDQSLEQKKKSKTTQSMRYYKQVSSENLKTSGMIVIRKDNKTKFRAKL